ncbi:hypothetical protein GBAR_LOCUS11237 [Geodia barretti]|nr:hypothetical protein GBAR_LOCUS11237 [Geodia barretti]
MSEKERYESLCREPWPLPKEYDSELTCFYYDNHRTPSLVIRPMKVEVVFPQTSYIHTAWDIDRARDETTEGVGWTNIEPCHCT